MADWTDVKSSAPEATIALIVAVVISRTRRVSTRSRNVWEYLRGNYLAYIAWGTYEQIIDDDSG